MSYKLLTQRYYMGSAKLIVQFCVSIGGHLRPDIYSATALSTERYGIEAAAEIVRFELSHMKIIEELVRKHNIDCDLTFTRSYDMYLDENELKKAKVFYDYLVSQGFDFMDDVEYMSPAETQEVSFFFRQVIGCIFEFPIHILQI